MNVKQWVLGTISERSVNVRAYTLPSLFSLTMYAPAPPSQSDPGFYTFTHFYLKSSNK